MQVASLLPQWNTVSHCLTKASYYQAKVSYCLPMLCFYMSFVALTNSLAIVSFYLTTVTNSLTTVSFYLKFLSYHGISNYLVIARKQLECYCWVKPIVALSLLLYM